MEPTGEPGVARITLPVPFALDHVHCYALARDDGGYTLVDGGLDGPDSEPRWERALAALDGPVREIFVTHHHPDHIGGVASLAARTGAPVLQGRLDRAQSSLWSDADTPQREEAHLRRHGVPAADAAASAADTGRLSARMALPAEVREVHEGEDVGGWTVVSLPGHADGHLGLERDGVLVAGDAVLEHVSPHVGVYAESEPDPLRRYLTTLRALASRPPRVALTGHHDAVTDVAGRARELIDHHGARLDALRGWLGDWPRTAYWASQHLFGSLPAAQLRFAVTEAVAHLERLVHDGEATRLEDDGRIGYAAGLDAWPGS